MRHILIYVKGFIIGIANIIPGVSGGTFALILGLFERLMDAIKAVTPQTIKIFLMLPLKGFSGQAKEEFVKEWKRIDANFLLILGMGAVSSILASSWAIDYLLKNHPGLTLAFFIGLILPSLLVPYKMMQSKKWHHFLWLIPGVALTVGLAFAFSGNTAGRPGPLMTIASGAIAISAMILPGISGSFVLLVMGQYMYLIEALKILQTDPLNFSNLFFISMFGLGCLIGLASFARLLSFLLRKFPSPTLVFLIGLIVGSFWVLWPFKDYDKGHELVGKKEIKIVTAPNRMPLDLNEIYPCAISLVLGVIGAGGVTALGREGSEASPEEKKKPEGETV